MNRTGTEYLTMRTVISDERSTRGVSIRPGSNGSGGNGASIGCSAVEIFTDGADPVGDAPVIIVGLPSRGYAR